METGLVRSSGRGPNPPDAYIHTGINTSRLTKKKGKTALSLRVERSDLAKWRASAKKNGLTLTEYVRRRVNERPLRTVKPRYYEPEPEPETKAAIQARELEQERDRERRERVAEEHARRREIHELEQAAWRMAQHAGGTECWFAKLSVADREKYAGAKNELLKREERVKSGVCGLLLKQLLSARPRRLSTPSTTPSSRPGGMLRIERTGKQQKAGPDLVKSMGEQKVGLSNRPGRTTPATTCG